LNWAKGLDKNGRPISNNLIPDEKGVLVCPSGDGATNWYSPSYDPTTNMFYFRSMERCSVITKKPELFEEGRTYYATGGWTSPGQITKGYINAFDLKKLDFAWRNPQIGTFAWAGVMSTATGLVAFGDDSENFVIVDGRTGTPLWHMNVGQPIRASPMSYAVNGKQYIAISAGTGDLFAFTLLPGRGERKSLRTDHVILAPK